MANDFQLIHITVDEARLKGASNRLRNQFVGCMHAHNELTILNRLLMFTMNDTGDGELHNSAQSAQMWCMLQILAAKPFEDSALKIIRDKTAFHYDRLNLTEAADNLAACENSLYLAQHPANSLYYMGSALVFRAIFAMIADKAG